MNTSPFPCDDERCAQFITQSAEEDDKPFVCLHYHNNAEAIDYWGRVLDGDLTPDDVIEPYREFLNFDMAAARDPMDYRDDDMNWTGPTVDIEIRVAHETVNTVTAYPLSGFDEPDFDTAMNYANGYADACYEQHRDA